MTDEMTRALDALEAEAIRSGEWESIKRDHSPWRIAARVVAAAVAQERERCLEAMYHAIDPLIKQPVSLKSQSGAASVRRAAIISASEAIAAVILEGAGA